MAITRAAIVASLLMSACGLNTDGPVQGSALEAPTLQLSSASVGISGNRADLSAPHAGAAYRY